ncbi:hypothetical protein CCP3SC1_680005 [Gammaproteobacteria bacterium]
MVHIESSELESVVDCLVIKKLQELLSLQPPESRIALMLHAYLRDFGELHYEIRLKFKKAEDQ